MKHLGTITLETPRLILRPFKETDAEALYDHWASDDEVTKYLMWSTHKDDSISKFILSDWIKRYEQKAFYQWAITLKSYGDEPIGCIGVTNKMNDIIQMAHIGYCIGKQWWNQGITSEALKHVMGFLFEEVGVQRIESRHDPKNPSSGAVMKKCGMKLEGTLRRSDWNNQGVCDACYYAMLASEWNDIEI